MRPLDEIKRDADNASEGPWTFARWNVGRSFDNMYGLLGDGELQHCLPIYVKFTAIEDDDDGNPIDKQGEKDATFVVNARQDVPDLLAEVARLTAIVKVLETDGVELKAAVDEMLSNADAMAEKLIAQRARVAELEAALGPLAALDSGAFVGCGDSLSLVETYGGDLTLGDVRRARKALGEGGK